MLPWLAVTGVLFVAGMYADKKFVKTKSLQEEAFDMEIQKIVKEAVETDTLDIRGWFYQNPKSKDQLGAYQFGAKRLKPSNLVLLGEKRMESGQIVMSVIEVGTKINSQNKVESTHSPFYVTQKNFTILQEIVSQVKGHHTTLL
jgi:hypothetical protein